MVKDDLAEILRSLSLRSLSNRREGIGLAGNYLADFKPSDFNVSPEEWQKHLDEAAERFTFCDDGFETKAYKEVDSATDGAVLTFDGICSTVAKDRDGDVIEASGLVLDHKMPLLWQHVQHSPVGKHVSLIEQNEKHWASHWAIAATELGKDCAILVKFGALRLSIGFQPLELEPLSVEDDGHGGKYVTGWHIKRAAVMETSLVSIPANAQANIYQTYAKEFDGICTAYGRKMLQHDAVKHWAKEFYDKRPTQVQGADVKGMEAIENKDTGGGELPAESSEKCPECGEMKLDKTGTCQACGHVVGKSTEVEAKSLEQKGMSHYPKGCYEFVAYELNRTASEYLKGKGIEVGYWADVYYTFPDYAVVCASGSGRTKCYKIGYKMDGTQPVWEGDVTEVDVEPAIISKLVSDKLVGKSVEVVKTVEVVKEVSVEKEVVRDCTAKEFIEKSRKGGVQGYRNLREVHDAYEAIAFNRDEVLDVL